VIIFCLLLLRNVFLLGRSLWQEFHNGRLYWIFNMILRNVKALYIYSETCLNRTSLWPILCSEWTGVQFIQVKITKIYFIGTLFKVRFILDSVLFSIRFRPISQYYNLYMSFICGMFVFWTFWGFFSVIIFFVISKIVSL
jgi:hypothetical protein